jgi:uncharacterized membrane protein YfcA
VETSPRIQYPHAAGGAIDMQTLLALVVGLAGGGFGGLVGLGGGFVMVPLLIYLFRMEQHAAQGTSLAVLVLPVVLPSALQYWRAGHVNATVALWAALGFLLGGWIGGSLAQRLGGRALRRLFAVCLLVVAVDLLRR